MVLSGQAKRIMKKKLLFSLLVFLCFFAIKAQAKNLDEFDRNVIAEYNKIKTQYINQKEDYKTSRTKFINAKTKWENNKNDANDTKSLLVAAKEYMLNGVDVMIEYLEIIEFKIDKSGLSEQDMAKMKNEINKDQAWLESKRVDIEKSTTRKQLEDLLKTGNDRWDKIKSETKGYMGEILIIKTEYVLKKIESAQNRINTEISEAKIKGYDVYEIEKKNSEVNMNIEKAKAEIELAKKDFQSVKSLGNADYFGASGNAKLEKANSYLREAHKIMKEMTLIAKKQKN